jgi:hypothetical protein
VPNTPSADFCRPVRIDRSTLSPESRTDGRSPEVSSTAFRTRPPDLQPEPLMDMDFAVTSQLVRPRMPLIRFLFIGPYVCSTLLSDPASRRRPCALLSLHLHQVVKRTFTFELSNMLGTHRDRGKPHSSAPPTPPDMRVRIRRFGGLSYKFHSQSGNPERVEVSIGQGDAERGRVRQPPWTMSAACRLRGQVGSHIPSA